MLDVVRPLVVSVAKMPKYTRKTRNLASPRVSQFRDALLSTPDPLDLLHAELPALEVEVRWAREPHPLLVDACRRGIHRLGRSLCPAPTTAWSKASEEAFGLTGGDADVRETAQEKGHVSASGRDPSMTRLVLCAEKCQTYVDVIGSRLVLARVILRGDSCEGMVRPAGQRIS